MWVGDLAIRGIFIGLFLIGMIVWGLCWLVGKGFGWLYVRLP